jgi:hypothetical protein
VSEDEAIQRFADLFAGRTDAYGTGEGRVIKQPLTRHQYERHLYGWGPGLGVFPLRDDGTVSFGAIDLDRPDFETATEMQGLIPGPSFLERSRSGNAHVWVFFERPAPAWVVRGILRTITEAVGEPTVEIFPKQDQIRGHARYGNYINLPYHGDTRPILERTGEEVTLGKFLLSASEQYGGLIDPGDWIARAEYLGVEDPAAREHRLANSTPFGEQPILHECAMHIIEHREDNPVREGSRAVVLHNLSRMLLNYRDMSDDEAWELVSLVNDASPDPLDQDELRRNFENAHGYTSTGCDNPLMAEYVSPTCPIAHPELRGMGVPR